MTDNDNKELFKAAAQEAEELHGVSLAEVMSNPDRYERFDEPSPNAMMCSAAELVDCGVLGCSTKVSTEEVYDYNNMSYCPKHDPEEWGNVLTAALGRQDNETAWSMGYPEAWLLSPKQAQQLSGASDKRMVKHGESSEFWLVQIDDGAGFWCAITENGTEARIYDIVVRYWCEENEGTTCETLLIGEDSFLTVQRVIDFCKGPACAPLEDKPLESSGV
tara:strand:- start:1067 stop:1723 length:657 start_codon:yes stop_codon:yes gene_type:complete